MLIAAVQDTVFSIIIVIVALLLVVGAAFLIRFEQKSYKKSKYLMINNFVKYPALQKLIEYRLKSKSKKGKEIYFTLLKVGIDDFDQLREYIGSKGEEEFREKIIQNLEAALLQGAKIAEIDERDAFIVYIPVFLDEEQTEDAINLFKQAAEKRVKVITGIPVQKSATVAVASYPIHGNNLETVVKKLEDAFVFAKKAGGNRVVIANDDIAGGGVYTERYALVKKAIAENAVKMTFNPFVDVARNKLAGAEAVLKWHKENGVMDYKAMIPYLEESGDDLWFGMWSLERALVSNVNIFRSEAVKEFNILIPAGLKQLDEEESAELLQNCADKYAVEARNIFFDVENLPYDNYSKLLKNLIQLQALGFKLRINADTEPDFEQAANIFNVDVISVGMNTILNDAQAAAKVFNYAEKKNKKVFVTGVESKEQLEMIREKKAAYAQGVYFGVEKTKEELLDIAENK